MAEAVARFSSHMIKTGLIIFVKINDLSRVKLNYTENNCCYGVKVNHIIIVKM